MKKDWIQWPTSFIDYYPPFVHLIIMALMSKCVNIGAWLSPVLYIWPVSYICMIPRPSPSSSHNTFLSQTFNWPPNDLQSQALNCTQSDFCLWTLRGTNGTPPGCDIRRQTGREKKRWRVDSVQHKCRLSDLPLMRRHLRQEGRRKLLLWKTHRWACHGEKKGWKWI